MFRHVPLTSSVLDREAVVLRLSTAALVLLKGMKVADLLDRIETVVKRVSLPV
jgi:hypothetical protein